MLHYIAHTLERKDRDWKDYPIGTKAHGCNGGYWIRTERGWKWCTGATFPRPGGDAVGKCIELPDKEATCSRKYCPLLGCECDRPENQVGDMMCDDCHLDTNE